ncbi:trypsin-like peptidase domain-containing protein [Flavobacterium microcysteis]|uniref:Trypsin-like peptidase domain-containing protein n=1 Tax=Flavobacterium microcysteis TaxID=2596891 RepID=A0A501QAN8_9FLAO|nr:trypsin-like peptidase domain-containing protein [Flavobacterium microcysteis]TPD69763.1 trypsin-like peptidase domain-containing protein [Flavobacterium microcysteis]
MIIHEDNFAYSISLSINEGKSKGSGFRLKYKGYNFIVSAKHVFYDSSNNLYGDLLIATCQSPLDDGKLIFQIHLDEAKIFYSKTSDVCVILLGKNYPVYSESVPLKDDLNQIKRPASLEIEEYIHILEESASHIVSVDIEATRNLNQIRIANEVYLMGYPTSLGLKENKYFDSSKPLMRKGIISGINIKENTFIIDCPSYQGNSGGPVVEQGEDGCFCVIGIVSQYIPYETEWYNSREKIKNTEVANSGFSVCIPFDSITELIESNLDSL